MVKFLDQAGLSALWNKIKQTFYTKAELEYDVMHTPTSNIIPGEGTYGSDVEQLINLILGGNTLTVDRIMEIVSTDETTLNASPGKYYKFTTEVNTLSIILPEISNSTFAEGIIFQLTIGNIPNIQFSGTNSIYKQKDFELSANKTYEVNAIFNGSNWIVASIEIDSDALYEQEESN